MPLGAGAAAEAWNCTRRSNSSSRGGCNSSRAGGEAVLAGKWCKRSRNWKPVAASGAAQGSDTKVVEIDRSRTNVRPRDKSSLGGIRPSVARCFGVKPLQNVCRWPAGVLLIRTTETGATCCIESQGSCLIKLSPLANASTWIRICPRLRQQQVLRFTWSLCLSPAVRESLASEFCYRWMRGFLQTHVSSAHSLLASQKWSTNEIDEIFHTETLLATILLAVSACAFHLN